MSFPTAKCALSCSVLSAALLLSPQSAAVTVAPFAAAVDRCQPALPTFDGNIRKRPKAVQNEGTTTAFVTCGFTGDAFASGANGIYYATLFLVNNTPGAIEINCTLVPGSYATVVGGFLPKTRVIPAGDTGALIEWSSSSYANGRFGANAAVSCALPPGAGIGEVLDYYTN